MHNLFFVLIMAALAGAPNLEAVTGTVLDADGRGAITATTDPAGVDPAYNYISYRDTAAADPGDVVTTVLILDADGETAARLDLCDGVITVE